MLIYLPSAERPDPAKGQKLIACTRVAALPAWRRWHPQGDPFEGLSEVMEAVPVALAALRVPFERQQPADLSVCLVFVANLWRKQVLLPPRCA
jgi:hypothetical protein